MAPGAPPQVAGDSSSAVALRVCLFDGLAESSNLQYETGNDFL
jgi:hypothetical protein